MKSFIEIKIPQASVESKGYQRFLALWNKENSDIENIIAMLEEFNFGTYSQEISETLRTFRNAADQSANRPVTVEYLLFLIREKIDFNFMEEDSDLAAIFSIIFERTDINPYLFSNVTELLAHYKQCIKENSDTSFFLTVSPHIINFINAGIISYWDIWDFCKSSIDNSLDRYEAFKLLATKNNKSIISNAELSDLFASAINEQDFDFAQLLYCIKYNVDIHKIWDPVSFVHSNHTAQLINRLLSWTDKQMDGDLLLIAIKCLSDELLNHSHFSKFGKMIPGSYPLRGDRMLRNLISKLDLFESGEKIIDKVIEYLHPNFIETLYEAMYAGKMEIIECLLKEKKFNIDLKSYINYGDPNREYKISLMQYIFFSHHQLKDQNTALFRLNVAKCFIKHDPDCVKLKDTEGRNIFWYLEEYRKNTKPEEAAIFNEIEVMIRKAYYKEELFTFFSGKNDAKSIIRELPGEIIQHVASLLARSK